jgi:hypothetical protein
MDFGFIGYFGYGGVKTEPTQTKLDYPRLMTELDT